MVYAKEIQESVVKILLVKQEKKIKLIHSDEKFKNNIYYAFKKGQC